LRSFSNCKSFKLYCDRNYEWPNEQEKANISKDFKNLGGIDNVIGAVDGTYCRIEVPPEYPTAYLNRKCFYYGDLASNL
jgi:hypothetical protein